MFSSPAPGRDSHLSFPIISSGFGGREAEAEGIQLLPTEPGSWYWGNQVPARLLPHWLHPCCSLPDPDYTVDEAPGMRMAEEKGMQLVTWVKLKQDHGGGKEAAFTQAAEVQFTHKIPPTCFKTRVSPGVGMAGEVEGSLQLRLGVAATAFPFQHTALMGANGVKTQLTLQGWRFLLELVLLLLSPWQTGPRSASTGTKPCCQHWAQHHATLLALSTTDYREIPRVSECET